MKRLSVVFFLIVFVSAVVSAESKQDSKPFDRTTAVFLHYGNYGELQGGTVFYNEVVVEESHIGSGFLPCAFKCGGLGLSESSDGKVIGFQIFKPTINAPASIPKEELGIKLLYKDKDVLEKKTSSARSKEFSLKYNWEVGQKYRFMVKTKLVGYRMEYSGYFYINKTKKWKRLVTVSILNPGKYLAGCYSTLGNYHSADKSTKARFLNGWLKIDHGCWISLTKARFSKDDLPQMNINAGSLKDGFFLQTGGKTKNKIKPDNLLERPPVGVPLLEEKGK